MNPPTPSLLLPLDRPLDRHLCRHPDRHLHPHAPLLATLLLLIAACLTASAQDVASAPTPEFSTFQIITERNIFNPNRSNRSVPAETRPTTRAPRVESFTLVGTLGDDGRWTAFFDGTRSELRGRLRPDETIGEFTLSAISNAGVQLENGTNTVNLRVGMQMRRENDGPWLLAERERSSRAERAGSPRESSTTTSTASASPGAAESDVLRRLRQQRERELQ